MKNHLGALTEMTAKKTKLFIIGHSYVLLRTVKLNFNRLFYCKLL